MTEKTWGRIVLTAAERPALDSMTGREKSRPSEFEDDCERARNVARENMNIFVSMHGMCPDMFRTKARKTTAVRQRKTARTGFDGIAFLVGLFSVSVSILGENLSVS